MLDRKLLVEALRVDNKDVLPKFGSSELRRVMEASTEYVSVGDIIDFEDGTITHDGALSLLDMLEQGSVGIADMGHQPALNFMKNGSEIYAHNMFTDEDEILDATPEALAEYIQDQMVDSEVFTPESSSVDAENVIFLKEPNEYTGEDDILAVFPDELEQAGDEGSVLCYSHIGQHSYASPGYIDELEEATPEEYEPLKKELEGQGYVLNVLNGLQQESVDEVLSIAESNSHFTSLKEAKKAIAQAKSKLQKELSKGIFYKNFGQKEVRELKDRIPYGDEIETAEKHAIQDAVNDFDDWCMNVTPESMNEEYTDIDAQAEDIENRIKSEAANIKNILISAYRNDEETGLEVLPKIFDFIEVKMDQLTKDLKNNFYL